MIQISFARDPRALLKGAEQLLVLGAADRLTEDRLPDWDPALRAQIAALMADVKPGAGGGSATTLTGTSPRRVTLGVLPSAASRHNAPARPDAIQSLVQGAGLDRAKKAAVAVLLEDSSHDLVALNAIGRAFPLVSLKSGERGPDTKLSILFVGPDGGAFVPSTATREAADAAREAARLVDSPPTALSPSKLVAEVRGLLAGVKGLKFKEIAGDKLLAAGLGGIHGVGRAALDAPRMLVVTHAPARAKGPHVALVGKGVTFDTGGLHLKPRGSMETMKCDMGGAAAVAGAFRALVKSGHKGKLSLIVCAAENAIGPASYKPDDVLTLHSGKTVEINNTDAEGRLLLGDGVSWAARELKADVVLDAATLTGAQMIATGAHFAGVVSNDAGLETLLVESGRATGDLCHPLPFAPELFQSEFKSPIADMRNSVKNRMNAQASCAAQFVYAHLEGTEVRWGHVDLAGPSFRADRGTGYGVALLAELVRRL